MSPKPHPLEETVGHRFADPALLRRALTHSSMEAGVTEDNERMEFLGDAVLGFIVAAEVFRRHPDLPEGALDRLRVACVNGRTLALRGRQIGLDSALQVSRAEMENNPERSDSMVENAFEALVGALFLDGGLPAAKAFVLRVLATDLDGGRTAIETQNPKGRLQEYFQARGEELPVYVVVDSIGPDHARHYTVEVRSGGQRLGRGAGSSLKAAESKAAEQALSTLTDR